MATKRAEAALRLARELARVPRMDLGEADERADSARAAPSARARVLAMGDPQAPSEVMFRILDRYGALGEDGRLRDDTTLISLGDHFDYGASGERRVAANSGLEILSWLAAHPRDQAIIIAGNHDLGRVGELAGFDDDTFAAVHAEAARAYRDRDLALEVALLDRYPALPSAEVAARDFAAFTVAQRSLVVAMLRARRLFAAVAIDDVLLSHAGVTTAQLAIVGLDADQRPGAAAIADALEATVARAVSAWEHGPLVIPGLHQPGDRALGEGGGMFYHRPANPAIAQRPSLFKGAYPRRYDARKVPGGVIQVVGHIADGKCRQLLGPWAAATPTPPGALRHLVTDGHAVEYRPGCPPFDVRQSDSAAVVFTDGGMNRVPPERYELLDVRSLTHAA